MMERTQSFFLKESNSNDKIRIFCFPYAGGGASAYRNWGTYLPDYVGVYPIQIPGRENRITEKALTDMCELMESRGKFLLKDHIYSLAIMKLIVLNALMRMDSIILETWDTLLLMDI